MRLMKMPLLPPAEGFVAAEKAARYRHSRTERKVLRGHVPFMRGFFWETDKLLSLGMTSRCLKNWRPPDGGPRIYSFRGNAT